MIEKCDQILTTSVWKRCIAVFYKRERRFCFDFAFGIRPTAKNIHPLKSVIFVTGTYPHTDLNLITVVYLKKLRHCCGYTTEGNPRLVSHAVTFSNVMNSLYSGRFSSSTLEKVLLSRRYRSHCI